MTRNSHKISWEIDTIISVIVPVYNVEKYLTKCVDSIIDQTYKNLEIILVDDGSPDSCGEICDKYAEKDARVKVIHKSNGGLVSARNAGYDVVTGHWHMYLDGDDWLSLDTCEKLVVAIERHPDEEMIFFNMIEELGSKSIKGKWKLQSDKPEIMYDRAGCVELSRMTLDHVAGVQSSCGKLINTEHAKNNNIRHNPKLIQGSEDTEFALRAFYSCNKCLYIDEYLYHYRYNPNSISKKIDERNSQYLADCYAEIEKEIVGFERYEDFKATLYQDVLYVIVTIAVTTYFHPENKEVYKSRVSMFKNVIMRNEIFTKSLRYGSLEGIDKKRRFTIFCIRQELYFLIDFVAYMKIFLMKYGYYKY